MPQWRLLMRQILEILRLHFEQHLSGRAIALAVRLSAPWKTYDTGPGHLRHLTKPDQVTARPELYKEYVRTLAATLAARKGYEATGEEIDAIANDLGGVATSSKVEAQQRRIQSVESSKASYAKFGKGFGDTERKSAEANANRLIEDENVFSTNIIAMANGLAKQAGEVDLVENTGGLVSTS
jgi:hypothetical protein